MLPWAKTSGGEVDILKAKEILDADHYDLKKVKDRILDYLSVRRLKPDMKGPILCFVGPPGVGKTSLGKSIARALGRKFVRLSLGGVHDEAEIRGHRRTYIGALPGQIIQGIRRAETNDPVFMLDEIDKVGRDFRGDPASALLEALDPEQNATFRDNYLDVTFDLVEGAVHHHGEHARSDSRAAARPHGDHRAAGLHGRRKGPHRVPVPDSAADRGKRNHGGADRVPARGGALRHPSLHAGSGRPKPGAQDRHDLPQAGAPPGRRQDAKSWWSRTEIVQEFLGGIKVRSEGEIAERTKRAGVAVGLAWTPAGGDILFIEANTMKGKGGFTMTGQIGQVMQESMQAALTWVRSNAASSASTENFFAEHDIHIHVPAGAIPERWSFSRRDHGDCIGLAVDSRPVRPSDGDDRRNHAERQCASDRRSEGKGAGCQARWGSRRHSSRRRTRPTSRKT